jgi:phage FluMu protein Com
MRHKKKFFGDKEKHYVRWLMTEANGELAHLRVSVSGSVRSVRVALQPSPRCIPQHTESGLTQLAQSEQEERQVALARALENQRAAQARQRAQQQAVLQLPSVFRCQCGSGVSMPAGTPPGTRFRCGHCGAVLAMPGLQPASVAHMPCPACTFVNDIVSSQGPPPPCRMCGSPLLLPRASPAPAPAWLGASMPAPNSNGPSSASVGTAATIVSLAAKQPQPRPCTACTFMNAANAVACVMCGTALSGSVRPVLSPSLYVAAASALPVNCPRCTMENTIPAGAATTKCSMCDVLLQRPGVGERQVLL